MKKTISPVIATTLLLIVMIFFVIFVNVMFTNEYDNEYPKEYEDITELNEIPVELYHYVKDFDYKCYAIQEKSYLKPRICCDKIGQPLIRYDYTKDKFLVILNETSCEK